MNLKTETANTLHWFSYVLILLIASMPLIYYQEGVDPNLLPRQIAICIYVIAASLVLFFHKKQQALSFSSVFPCLFIGLTVLYWLTSYHAINFVEAKFISLKITTYACAFIVSYLLLKTGIININQISIGFSISLIVTVLLVFRDILILQKLGVKLLESDNVYKINATFGHKNLLSGYLLFNLPFALIQWKLSGKKLTKALLLFFSFLAFAIIVLLQTRAVLLALIVSIIVMAICMLFFTVGSRGFNKKVSALILLLSVVVFVSGLYIFRDKFSVITRTESFKERAALWENSFEMIKEYPLGVGAGNWQILLPKYGIQKFYEFNYRVSEGLTTFQRPHNDYIWVMSETGIAGGLVYIGMFMLLFWYSIQHIRVANSENERTILILLNGLLVAYAVVSLVDFPLERMEHSFLFALLAALLSSGIKGRINIKINKGILIAPILLSVVIIYVSKQRIQSEVFLKKMYRAHGQADWQQLATVSNKAETEYMNMDYFSLPISWYSGVAYFASGDVQTAKKYFLNAYKVNPYQVHVLNNLGVCYEKEKDYTNALPLLEKAHEISPTFSDGISTLAGAYYNTERYDDAWKVMSKFKYDKDNYQFKVFATAIIKARFNKLVEAEHDENIKKRMESVLKNDELIMEKYKQAQEAGISFEEIIRN